MLKTTSKIQSLIKEELITVNKLNTSQDKKTNQITTRLLKMIIPILMMKTTTLMMIKIKANSNKISSLD